jgi:hypothetical protein
MAFTKYLMWALIWLLARVADQQFNADSDPDPVFRIRIQLFTLMRIRILLFIKVMQICDRWSTDHPGLYFEPLRLHCERSRPCTAQFLSLLSSWILTLVRIRIRNPAVLPNIGIKYIPQTLNEWNLPEPSHVRAKRKNLEIRTVSVIIDSTEW